LVIDEISMLDGALFDALEFIARSVRQDERSFGGIQLVLCGDFFQLPPVGLAPGPVGSSFGGKGAASFCFEAASWARTLPFTCCFVLSKVFRQRDEAFVRLLGEVRRGQGALSPETCKALLATAVHSWGDLEPTRLYSLKREVDEVNERRLGGLEGSPVSFSAKDSGLQPYLSQLQKHCPAPEQLLLKPGAQVMLLKNLDPEAGLVNGTRGRVLRLDQGRRGDWRPVVELHVAHTAKSPGAASTVVKRLKLEEWSIEAGGKTVARRLQIPLRLAWAISIHKSQGMTIDALEADLGTVFEYGQAYVALSRATSLERLRVLNFAPWRVKTHPQVAEFGRRLELEANRRSSESEPAVKPAPPDILGLLSHGAGVAMAAPTAGA
jgi:ATP-dependent DNA helicase PIF1